jgi:hypothetical protein
MAGPKAVRPTEKHEWKCFFCQGKPDRLMFYSRYYESAYGTVENPMLVCGDCRNKAFKALDDKKGGNGGVRTILLSDLGKYKPEYLSFLTSSKRRELNHLAARHWRRTIWRLHYLWKPKKESHGEGHSEGCAGIPGKV